MNDDQDGNVSGGTVERTDSPRAAAHERRQVRQTPVARPRLEELPGGAVEPDQEDARHSPSGGQPTSDKRGYVNFSGNDSDSSGTAFYACLG